MNKACHHQAVAGVLVAGRRWRSSDGVRSARILKRGQVGAPAPHACDFVCATERNLLTEESLDPLPGYKPDISNDQGRGNGCDKSSESRRFKFPYLDFDRCPGFGADHSWFRGRGTQGKQAIARSGTCLLNESRTDVNELVVQRLAAQMSTHHGELNLHPIPSAGYRPSMGWLLSREKLQRLAPGLKNRVCRVKTREFKDSFYLTLQ